MSEANPYRPPAAHVEDVVSAAAEPGEFVDGGQALAAGRGWGWIAGGFGIFKAKPGTWILITIVLGVIFIVMGLIPVLGAVATWVLYPVFAGGIMLGCHAAAHGDELEVGHIFAGFRNHAGNLAVIGLLSIVAWIIVFIPVILVIGAGAFFGTISGDPQALAAIGPGVIVAWLVALGLAVPVYMALWFAPALVVLRGLAPIESLKQSFRGCWKNVIPFLVYGVIMMVLIVLAAIPFGLGLLVMMPVIMASVYVAYGEIFFRS
jgi:uncharacterized membrane protein